VLTKSDAIIVKFLGKPVYTVAEVKCNHIQDENIQESKKPATNAFIWFQWQI
jgi:hypothetical protein